jgi:hypothetical protein
LANSFSLRLKAKKGEQVAVAHEAKLQVVLTSENEQKLLQRAAPVRRHLKAIIIAEMTPVAVKMNCAGYVGQL